ncbi:MAG: restriction endonuclease subunit S [Victivallales bacterium]|nr:restriction endonuclease subunit S [Victivallales bacterium]
MRTTKFKASEIGPIPVEWEVRTIGEMACVCTGNSNTQDKVDTGKYPFYVRSPIVEHINEYAFDTEGVITVGDGVGTGKVFHYVNGKFALHQRCYLIDRFCPLLDGKYFYKIFSSRFYDRVMQMTAKSSVDSVRREMITGMLIPVPPLPEQRRIAEALSDADAWIESLEKLIEKKKLVKQGAMQALLSGKTRLPGFSGEWEERRLGAIGKSIRGVSFRPDQVSQSPMANATQLLRANNIQDSSFILDDVVYVLNECIAECQKLKDGDILICAANGSRNLVGKSAIWKQMTQASFGAFMAVFRSDKSVDASFVGYLFQSASYRRQLDDILTGSAINNLNAKDIEGLIFQLPTLAEQRAIASVLSDMDAELTALSREKAKAEQIKQGMMQELLTGRVRLGEGE